MTPGTTHRMIIITEGAAVNLFLELCHQEEEDTLGTAIPEEEEILP